VSLVVRPATPAEFPEIARVTLAAYEADGQVKNTGGYDAALVDVAGRAAAGELLVAVSGADVLGAVLFVRPGSPYAELSRPGEAEFRMLAVDPAAQGRGVGRALARACVDRAVAAGCTAMVICVRDFAAAAQRLYESIGFVRTPSLDWSPVAGVQLWALRLDLAAPAAH
jgi:ribosomal protein S18 acetylase RimI-like enzyme